MRREFVRVEEFPWPLGTQRRGRPRKGSKPPPGHLTALSRLAEGLNRAPARISEEGARVFPHRVVAAEQENAAWAIARSMMEALEPHGSSDRVPLPREAAVRFNELSMQMPGRFYVESQIGDEEPILRAMGKPGIEREQAFWLCLYRGR